MKTNRLFWSLVGGVALTFGACTDEPIVDVPDYAGFFDAIDGIDGTLPDGIELPDGVDPSELPDSVIGPDGTIDPDSVVTAPGTVKALQIEAEALGCDESGFVNVGDDRLVTGAVVISGKFDLQTNDADDTKSLDGYYISDVGGGAFSGIQVSVLRSEGTDWKPGDTLDLTGNLLEFYCMTQYVVTQYEVTGTAAEPAPVELAPADAMQEAWEASIVKVTNVEVLAATAGGVYEITGGMEIGYGFPFFLNLDVGATYDLTGVLRYAFGTYQLAPRSEADIVKVKAAPTNLGEPNTTIKEIQGTSDSIDCTEAKINNFGTGLVFDGIIASARFSPASKLHGYYLSDGTGEPLSGVTLILEKTENSDFAVGTKLRIEGQHTEFYCMTQVKADAYEVLNENAVLADPIELDLAFFTAAAEDYEGVDVKLSNVEITALGADFDKYGEIAIASNVVIDDAFIGKENYPADLTVGETFVSVRGFVTWSFEKYRVLPETIADFNTGAVVVEETPDIVEMVPDTTDVMDTMDTTETIDDAGDTGPTEEVLDDATEEVAEEVTEPDAIEEVAEEVTEPDATEADASETATSDL